MGGFAGGQTSGTRVRACSLAVIPGLVWMVVFVFRAGVNPYGGLRFTLFDDAMISMTYGRTLADTGEWVWFPGADRVQGITNPMWSLVMAFEHALGLSGSAAALTMSIVGCASVVAVSWLVFETVGRTMASDPSALPLAMVAGGAVPFIYPFVFWSLRGMEVGVLCALVMLVVFALGSEGDRPRVAVAATAASLAVLVRLDVAVLVLAVTAVELTGRPRCDAGELRRRRRNALVVAGATVAAASAVLAFQWRYWGDWLPNTYRLKVEGYGTGERLVRGVVSLGKSLPLLVVVALGVWVVERSSHNPAIHRCRQLAVAMLAGVVYATWVGGDAWESYLTTSRYVSTVLPFALAIAVIAMGVATQDAARHRRVLFTGCLLVPISALGAGLVSNPYRFHMGYAVGMAVVVGVAVSAAVALSSRSSITRAAVVVALVVASVSAYPVARWVRFGGLHVADDHYESEVGASLQASTDDSAVIAVSLAGASAYYSERPMIDLLGKSDPVIAGVAPSGPLYPGHNKYDYDYSIGQLRPDVVVRTATTSGELGVRLTGWGYTRRCLVLADGEMVPSWFRADSTLIRWDDLRDCPAER
jgi:hypothetical protein